MSENEIVKTLKMNPTQLYWLTNAIIIGSILLFFAFARENKVGSALLQVSITMSLIGSNFDLYNKAQSLKSKPLATLVTWGWLAAMVAFLFASIAFGIKS